MYRKNNKKGKKNIRGTRMIVLDHDGRYMKAIMFDDKSYVLQDYDGKKKIKGNTLTGRSNEAFLIQFINDGIDHILNEEPEKLKEDYDLWHDRIQGKLMTVELVKKRQTLGMSIEEYKNKKKSDSYSPIAQYEAALQDNTNYLQGDVIETWLEEPEPILKEYKTKENVWKIPKNVSGYEIIRLAKNYDGNIYRHHYLDRLEKGAKKFLVVLGWKGFQQTFPNISLLKDDRAKMIPVWGLEKFMEQFEDFGFRQKDYNKMSDEDQHKFRQLVENGTLNEDYGEYYEQT